MITIPVAIVNGVLAPSTPIPSDALAVACDGEIYTVYQPGDTLPEVPIE
ncbi:hypothetical protein [Burkholderia sp. Tr-20355]|nr:hypothetical protein [Burkholderia sp. Tr-20355]MBN3738079.1 hypothetical protein [Burkholderia sp. Tr-20355]